MDEWIHGGNTSVIMTGSDERTPITISIGYSYNKALMQAKISAIVYAKNMSTEPIPTNAENYSVRVTVDDTTKLDEDSLPEVDFQPGAYWELGVLSGFIVDYDEDGTRSVDVVVDLTIDSDNLVVVPST